jgi:predicted HTH domain antitoxin
MKMPDKTLSISIPDTILIALNETEQELGNDMKVYTAMWLYIKGKLTIGKAAKLAGKDRYSFELLLAENKIPISFLIEDDIENDVKILRKFL